MTAPWTMSTLPWREDIPRGGLARETAVIGIATSMLYLNRVEGKPGFVATAVSPATTAALTINIDGAKYALASGATWNLTGQAVVPPFSSVQYLLLVNAAGVTSVYAGVPGGLNDQWQWAPNPPEALINAMNRDNGYSIVGYVNVVNNAATPWTPGTAYPTGTTNPVVDGLPGDMLMRAPLFPGQSPAIIRR